MARSLTGKKVAALITKGFEQIELIEPQKALQNAGATVDIVSLERGSVRGWNRTDWGTEVAVDRTVDECRADEYDALLLPGGVMNPDKLRMNQKAVQLVRAFFDQGKPIAAICHAPWMLVEADVVRGCRVTSYPSLKTDLRNAGADWTDAEVVVDRGVVTSRKPDDIPGLQQQDARGVRRRPARRCRPPPERARGSRIGAHLSLAPYIAGALVGSKRDELGVAQRALPGPFDERDFDDDPRLDPAEFAHVLRRHAFAPVAGLGRGQIDEGTEVDLIGLDQPKHFGPVVWRESRAHAAGEVQVFAFVVAHDQRVE